MIEFFSQPNVWIGIPAIIAGLLVMRAFFPYAFFWRGTAVAHLGAAIFWMAGRTVCRSIWWDLFTGFGYGNSSNWIWNLMGLIACYHALIGFYLLIPENEREDYNVLTAAFYPRRLWRRLYNSDDVK